MKTLPQLIRGNTVEFQRYRGGCLVYAVIKEIRNPFRLGHPDKIITMEFEVPVEDLQGTTVNATEKASVFMKWIKKALKDIIEAEEY